MRIVFYNPALSLSEVPDLVSLLNGFFGEDLQTYFSNGKLNISTDDEVYKKC